MRQKKQGKKNTLTLRIKKSLLDRGLTVTRLSRDINHDRTVVSHAINNSRYPKVREKIAHVLGINS